ncbi:signal transduction histidine kinase [Kutzneria viridogrisea]|nr:histidine kinase [Kutzneria albida]MBA8930267.1 signal transduction histidine kinase [Kutzneria viridogrisea]
MLERLLRLWGVTGWRQVVREVVLITLTVLTTPTLETDPTWPAYLAVGVLAVVLRLRFPTTALVLVGLGSYLPLAVVSYWAGLRVPAIPRLLGGLLGLLVSSGIYLAVSQQMPHDFGTWSLLLAFALLLVVVPVVIGRNVAQRRLLVTALRDRAFRLERERRSIVAETRMRERTRIAVDMHDTLGHQLTLISLHAGGLTVATEPGSEQAQTAVVLHDTARRAMAELRGIVGVLNEGAQDSRPHEAKGLAHLPELLETARSAGAHVEYTEIGDRVSVGSRSEHAVYRVLQEGLTNALRHAPGARVRVRLTFEPDAVIAEVTNTAPLVPPLPAEGGGKGLVGLRERARLAGGVLHHAATEDEGFRLAIVLPYNSEALPATDEPEQVVPEEPGADLAPGTTDVATLIKSLRPRTSVLTAWIVALLALAVALMTGFIAVQALWHGTSEVDARTLDALHVGQSEQDVLAALDDPATAEQHRLTKLADPHSAQCDVFAASNPTDPEPRYGYRLCFADGVLTEKRRFDIPVPPR